MPSLKTYRLNPPSHNRHSTKLGKKIPPSEFERPVIERRHTHSKFYITVGEG